MASPGSRAGTARRSARIFFSVAQHSLLVEKIAAEIDPSIGRAERLFMLLHDAPEYVIGDMISPFKAVIGDAYKAVENRILGAILLRFSLPATPSPAIAKLAKQATGRPLFSRPWRLPALHGAKPSASSAALRYRRRRCTDEIAPAAIEETQARFLTRFRAIDRL